MTSTVPVFSTDDCATCPIRSYAVCARSTPDELAYLEEIKYYRSFDPGQMIAWAHEPMDFVGSIVTGVASLSHSMEDGRRQMVGLSLPADFIGWPGRAVCAFDVQTIEPITLCCFRRKPFEELLRRSPQIANRLLEMTMDELESARQWMTVLGRKTARERVASFLFVLAERETKRAAHPSKAMDLHLPLTRESIADYLGLTIETVSRQFSHLKRDGVISLRDQRCVHIPDLPTLAAQAGDDVDGGVIV